MNEKINKFITILLVFSFFLFDVSEILPIVSTVNAQEHQYTRDELDYAVGSIVNGSQGGNSTRDSSEFVSSLGKNVIDTVLQNGGRLSDIVKTRGKEMLFNPSGKIQIENFIDSAYGAYRDFSDYVISEVQDERMLFHVDRTFYAEYNHSQDILIRGFFLYWGDNVEFTNRNAFVINKVNYNDVRGYNKMRASWSIPSLENTNEVNRLYMGHNTSGTKFVANYTGTRANQISYNDWNFDAGSPGSPGGVGIGLSQFARPPTPKSAVKSVHIDYLVLYKDEHKPLYDVVPYEKNNVPDLNQFTQNYNTTFSNAINNNNAYYTYNMEEILNQNTVINNEYVTNNYITINIIDDEEEDEEVIPPSDANDYTSLLDKILASIKALPDAIAEKLDFPEGSGEEGGGFWSGLFGAIGDLVSGISDFLTSIPTLFIELFDGLLDLVGKVIDLFVPSAEQVEELKGSLQLLVDDLTGKFDFVLEPVNQIKTVYSEPKSIYDLTIEYDEQVIYVVPSFLKSSLDKLKVLLNGSLVIFTFMSIYKRFVGREDVIK